MRVQLKFRWVYPPFDAPTFGGGYTLLLSTHPTNFPTRRYTIAQDMFLPCRYLCDRILPSIMRKQVKGQALYSHADSHAHGTKMINSHKAKFGINTATSLESPCFTFAVLAAENSCADHVGDHDRSCSVDSEFGLVRVDHPSAVCMRVCMRVESLTFYLFSPD